MLPNTWTVQPRMVRIPGRVATPVMRRIWRVFGGMTALIGLDSKGTPVVLQLRGISVTKKRRRFERLP